MRLSREVPVSDAVTQCIKAGIPSALVTMAFRSIAEAHGVTRAQLRAANDLASERVRAGEVLEIPSS